MPQPIGTATVNVNRSRRRRHGAAYKVTIGWWWSPAKWCGRMFLWVFAWPLGLWRSLRHGQRRP